jgi:hypothetical protein
MGIITSNRSGQIEKDRDYVLVGKERHDTGRPNDVGYPIRGIFKDSMLYLKNFEVDRWPSGNPETGYLNTDGSPTKTEILKARRSGDNTYYWKTNFGKRAAEELYNISKDPFCMNNLAGNLGYAILKSQLKIEMESKLTAQGDLRMLGYGHLYEQYPFTRNGNFYGRFMAGERTEAGWVNESDFEPYLLDGEGNPIGKVALKPETGIKD